jgi:cytochrome P450
VDQLAASPEGPGRYAPWRDRPVHQVAAGWVVSRPEEVREALASPALTVVPAVRASGSAGAARELQGRMARFSDGAVHQARRDRVVALLPGAAAAERSAREITKAALAGCAGTQEGMELARRVPVEVLTRALGVPSERVSAVVEATGQLCAALSPAPEAGRVADGDRAALALIKILEGRAGGDHAVAVISMLFQAHDATAALTGLALARAADGPGRTAAELVEAALRDDPPVQCTRRTSVQPAVTGGITIPAGEPVWILLAAAERGAPAPPATFGSGPHGCPGRELATALARGVVSGVLEAGWRPVDGPAPAFEARPNLRVPVSVPLRRTPVRPSSLRRS